MPSEKRVALTIAGSDPSGGAGIQADLKVFHQLGVYGMSVITLLTAQNTHRLEKVKFLEASWVAAQLDSILKDIMPHAVKTGALGTGEVVEVVAERAKQYSFPLVVDPVLVSTTGSPLAKKGLEQAFLRKLLPYTALVTPNKYEAEILSGRKIENDEQLMNAARCITDLGARAVLIKGGHFEGEAVDVLLTEEKFHLFSAKRVKAPLLHGTGCTLSAAIAAEWSKGGDVFNAVNKAKRYTHQAIQQYFSLGQGAGLLNHHA